MDRAREKADNAGDAAALTALYTKDATVMAPGAAAEVVRRGDQGAWPAMTQAV